MASAIPSLPRGRYLRYQFDNAAQLRRHCKLVDGRVLLFFPDPNPDLIPGSRILIELCFSRSEQQVALPARVRSRELHGTKGQWLELRALSIVMGLQSAVGSPHRHNRRLAFDHLAWVMHDGSQVLACPVLDFSRGGARLWGLSWQASPGDPVRLRIPYDAELLGQISWARGREAGVTFAEESLPAAAAIYASVEAAWATARSASHAGSCDCDFNGECTDPPAPGMLQMGAVR